MDDEIKEIEFDDRAPQRYSTLPVELCICGYKEVADMDPDWQPPYGHLNQAGGFCCPHHGDTCGYHSEAASAGCWW